MPIGVYFGLAAYGVFSVSDAFIKGLGSGFSPFLMGFWTAMFSAIPTILTRPKSERLSALYTAQRPLLLHARAALAFLAVLCVVYTFTHIPFAEAYALIFLAPVFSTILAVVVLKEHMTPGRWVGVALGFAGVLLVVRPGFRELSTGHLTAVLVAILGSGVAILLRQVSQTEQRITILAYALTYSFVLNGAILLILGQPVLPEPEILVRLAVIGMLGGIGNVLIVKAAQNAPAAWIAPTQYSQILWAVVLGALFFAEFPGPFTLVGLIVMAVAGYFSFPPGAGGDRGPVGGFAFLTGPRRVKRTGGRRRARKDQAD